MGGSERLPEEARWQLADLLAGIVRDARGAKGRDRRDAVSTVLGCPELNHYVRARSGLGQSWSDGDTWSLVSSAFSARNEAPPGVESRFLVAVRHLLVLAGPYDEDTTLPGVATTIGQMRLARGLSQRPFARYAALRRAVVGASLGYGDPADLTPKGVAGETPRRLPPGLAMVHRAAEAAILGALAGADFSSIVEDRLRRDEPPTVRAGHLVDTLRTVLVAELSRPPSHYPRHLTTPVLASLLDPALVTAEESTTLELPTSLPRLWEAENELVERFLRSRGARSVVSGDPGAGKTTLLKSIALNQLRGTEAVTAIYLALNGLAKRLGDATPHSASEAVDVVVSEAEEVYGRLSDAERRQLQSTLQGPDALLCLDGIDEVPEGGPRERVEGLLALLNALPGAVVVSSRPDPRVHHPEGWSRVRCRPLPSGRARTFIEQWYPDPEDEHRAQALATLESPGAKGADASPLLVGFVAYAASFGRTTTSIGDLYDQYVALTLERIWKEPHRRELSDVTIADLRRVARHMAWTMAQGNVRSNDKHTGWQDQASLSEFLETFDRPDHDAIARIVQSEGLFRMASAAATRLHTRYVWTHRTIQEHLVGMHLLSEATADETEVVSLVDTLLEADDDWSVPLTHLYGDLPDDARLAVVRRLMDRSDDPTLLTGMVGDLFDKLFDTAEPVEDSGIWALAMAMARDLLPWTARFAEDPSAAKEELLLAIRRGEDVSGEITLAAPDWRLLFNEPDLDALGAALLQHPRTNSALLTEVVKLLIVRAPVVGARLYLAALESGHPGLLQVYLTRVDQKTTDELIAAVGALPWPEPGWRGRYFLERALSVDLGSTLSSGPAPPAARFAELIGEDPVSNATSLAPAVRASLRGDGGEMLAYLTGRGPGLGHIGTIEPHPWAIVGAWERALAVGGDYGGTPLIRDEPLASADVLTSYEPSWRTDPERMRRTYRAIADSVVLPDTVPLAALVEFCRRFLTDEDRNACDYVRPIAAFDEVQRAVNKAFEHRGVKASIELMLATDSAGWAGTGDENFLVAAYADRLDQPRHPARPEDPPGTVAVDLTEQIEDGFCAIVNWGARAGLSFMPSFGMSTGMALGRMQRVFDRLEPTALRLRPNLAWLDFQMGKFTHDWRRRRREVIRPLFASEPPANSSSAPQPPLARAELDHAARRAIPPA